MSIDEALALVKAEEERAHRANGEKRGRMIHEAFDIVITAAESFLLPQKQLE